MIFGISGFGSALKAQLLHKRIRYLSKKDWNNRNNHVFRINPEYRNSTTSEVEAIHHSIWSKLRPDFSFDTLRICNGISGVADPETVPEEVYVSEIEPCLNHYRDISYLANKNFYNRWFSNGLFPNIFFHNIDGDFYDNTYKLIDQCELDSIIEKLKFPVVIKPSLGPGGGKDVYFPKDRVTLEKFMIGNINFVVQELIYQHEFFNSYNPNCLNTFRVCTYRSVVDNVVHVLNVSMRMGKGGSLDNETAGGIVCGVLDDGRLNNYAVDKFGAKFFCHPDTGKDFSEQEIIPNFSELIELSKNTAQEIYLCRLASLDACLDETGKWRLIEINLFNQTIRFSQYVGRPFFGRFTQEVINYCIKHKKWR